ncbi:hypothetical protein ACFQ0B_57870 [Nonomuraea thailandensis]
MPATGSGRVSVRTGSMRSTSGRFAISAASFPPAVTLTALTIQNGV